MAQFPNTGELQPRVDAKSAKNFLVARKHITEFRQRTRRSFRKSEAAGAAACAFAERRCFQHKHGLFRRQLAQPCGGRKPGEAAANNGAVHLAGEVTCRGTKVNGPGRRAPGMRFAGHSLFDATSAGWTHNTRAFRGPSFLNFLKFKFYVLRPAPYPLFGGVTRAKRTARIASPLTKSGNHTGEIHGRGIRNKTSGSRSESGQRTVAQSTA